MLKTAFLADQRIAPRGFEPLEVKRQPVDNKPLTTSTNPVFATGLAKIVQKYPELRELVKVWPELPGHIKAAIKALIQTHTKGD